MKKLLLLIVVLAAAAAVVVLGLKPEVRASKVARGKAIKPVPGSVIVQAEFEMNLRSEISGRVVQSELDPGRTVRKGSALVIVDTGDVLLEIERTENELQAAKDRIAVGSSIALELETAREEFENFERLTKAGTYPQAELEKQRRKVKTVEQRLALEKVKQQEELDTLENTLKVLRRRLEKMTIVSPIDGVVSAVYARVGDLIGEQAPLATLISTSRTVEARISEENFSGIRVGQKGVARLLGYGGDQYTATVSKVLPAADAATQRYIVHLELDIAPERLVPGLTGEVNLVVAERENALLVPRRALVGEHVLVVRDGVIETRAVEKGYESLTEVEILKGLSEGEWVVTDELERFRDGDKVRIANE
jgi:RND family efflux transporter MFP subunit